MRGDDELALAADLHRDHALVPALDDAPLADRKLERCAAVDRTVELRAALKPAGVVYAHRVARLGTGPGPFHQVDVAQPRRGLYDLIVRLIAHDKSLMGMAPLPVHST